MGELRAKARSLHYSTVRYSPRELYGSHCQRGSPTFEYENHASDYKTLSIRNRARIKNRDDLIDARASPLKKLATPFTFDSSTLHFSYLAGKSGLVIRNRHNWRNRAIAVKLSNRRLSQDAINHLVILSPRNIDTAR